MRSRTSSPRAVSPRAEVQRVRESFGIDELVMVGDGGMIGHKERLVVCRNPQWPNR